MRKFMIPAEFTPNFWVLMEVVGGLRIPFDEEAFVDVLGFLEKKMKKKVNKDKRDDLPCKS
ncbi:hypothetical protein QJS10_CPA16g00603 [Acorus calamus]|uniref:Uncharacterized protein n=1 Tax=Acorus calamus TaxID=4465 RepID=A0AAV9D0E3_ACOCL|nr:hypothetical protein QJS10_CPA16g00603 [Acorus calamus]